MVTFIRFNSAHDDTRAPDGITTAYAIYRGSSSPTMRRAAKSENEILRLAAGVEVQSFVRT